MNLLFLSPKGMEAPSSEKLAKDGVVENLPSNTQQQCTISSWNCADEEGWCLNSIYEYGEWSEILQELLKKESKS